MKSDSRCQGRTLSIQMEFRRQRGIDHRDLGSGIQQNVVGAGMVDRYDHDHLLVVCEMEGYTCDHGLNAKSVYQSPSAERRNRSLLGWSSGPTAQPNLLAGPALIPNKYVSRL